MAEKVSITYETLFDIIRLEKNTGELQKLNDSFYEDVVGYLNEKNKILTNEQESLFSEAEKDKTRTQIQNIKKLIKEIYEKREKKIIDLALNKARTGSNLLDLSALLPQEKSLFNKLVEIFSKNKEEILVNLINGRQPTLKETLEESEKEENEPETKTIRFIHPVPKFLGKNLETYGPFEPEETAILPPEIAEILIRKGRAEEIEES